MRETERAIPAGVTAGKFAIAVIFIGSTEQGPGDKAILRQVNATGFEAQALDGRM